MYGCLIRLVLQFPKKNPAAPSSSSLFFLDALFGSPDDWPGVLSTTHFTANYLFGTGTMKVRAGEVSPLHTPMKSRIL
jgi:hypothetical protein